jgi:hypothetical protein
MESRNPSAEPQVDVLPDTAGISRRRLLPMIGAAGLAGIAPRAFSRDDGFGRPSNAVARYVYVGTYTLPTYHRVALIQAPRSVSRCSV